MPITLALLWSLSGLAQVPGEPPAKQDVEAIRIASPEEPGLSFVVTRHFYDAVPADFSGNAPLRRVVTSEILAQHDRFRESQEIKEFHAGTVIKNSSRTTAFDGQRRVTSEQRGGKTYVVISNSSGRSLACLLRDPLLLTDPAAFLCDTRDRLSIEHLEREAGVEVQEDSDTHRTVMLHYDSALGRPTTRLTLDKVRSLPSLVEERTPAGEILSRIEVMEFNETSHAEHGWTIAKLQRVTFRRQRDGTQQKTVTSVEVSQPELQPRPSASAFAVMIPEDAHVLNRTAPVSTWAYRKNLVTRSGTSVANADATSDAPETESGPSKASWTARLQWMLIQLRWRFGSVVFLVSSLLLAVSALAVSVAYSVRRRRKEAPNVAAASEQNQQVAVVSAAPDSCGGLNNV